MEGNRTWLADPDGRSSEQGAVRLNRSVNSDVRRHRNVRRGRRLRDCDVVDLWSVTLDAARRRHLGTREGTLEQVDLFAPNGQRIVGALASDGSVRRFRFSFDRERNTSNYVYDDGEPLPESQLVMVDLWVGTGTQRTSSGTRSSSGGSGAQGPHEKIVHRGPLPQRAGHRVRSHREKMSWNWTNRRSIARFSRCSP